MTLTPKDIAVLDHAEAFISYYFNDLSNRPAATTAEKDLKEMELNFAQNGFIEEMAELSKVARKFLGTDHAVRFIRVANDLTEGAYQVGHPNSLKEYSSTLAMNAVFPEIKISGSDPGLEKKYQDRSCLPPRTFD